MRKLAFLAAFATAALVASESSAVLLIDSTSGASGVGNGALFSDPAGVVAPAAVGVNGFTVTSSNGFGRALTPANFDDVINFTDFNDITENPGVRISGWTNHRWEYIGGNDAFGFLENGGRLGKANAAHDGQAFANSSRYVLVSDAHSEASLGASENTYELSFLTGSDTGAFDLETFLVFDDSTIVSIDDRNINSAATTINLSGTTGNFYSTVRVMFAVDGPSGVRGLLDDVQLVVAVPEASAFLCVGMIAGITGLTNRRRRNR